jgi:hypothetical protein
MSELFMHYGAGVFQSFLDIRKLYYQTTRPGRKSEEKDALGVLAKWFNKRYLKIQNALHKRLVF